MNLYILEYNNYYNRILKKENSIEDYQRYVIHTLSNANFNPADGINTQHVFGSNVNAYDGKGDYLVAVDSENKIVSRWFILECVRSRAGQWTLDLYRDVLADFYDQAFNSTAFIEKGLIQNLDDPAIYNKEDMTFNQIKEAEYPITDSTNYKWIAIYIDQTFPTKTETFLNKNSQTVDVYGDSGSDIYNFLEGSSNYLFTNPHNKKIRYILNTERSFQNPSRYEELKIDVDTGLPDGRVIQGNTTSDYAIINDGMAFSTFGPNIFVEEFNKLKGNLSSNMMNIYSDLQNTSIIKEFSSTTTFYDSSSGKFFRVIAVKKGERKINRDIQRLGGPAWDDYVRVAQGYIDHYGKGTINNECPYASTEITFDIYQIRMVEFYPDAQMSLTISVDRNRVTDGPYDLIVMPYSDGETNYIYDPNQQYNKWHQLNGTASYFIAKELAQRYGNGANKHIYDIQLLPFCPIPELVRSMWDDGTIRLDDFEEDKDYVKVISGEDELEKIETVVFFAKQCTMSYSGKYGPLAQTGPTANIPDNITLQPRRAIADLKIQNETVKFRMCSGDYSSMFEFNPAQGAVTGSVLGGLFLDISYKPYKPYIRLAPQFSRLFGGEYHDGRGLVCSGDYSISTITDQFETYKLQNINFQRVFDRQIQNMEVQQKYSRIQDITGAITGTFAGAAAGGLAGSNFGPAGAAIGAGAGAIASGIGGIADVYINDKLRAEAIDYTKDQFGYELGNIKALPNTLNKVDSFNPDNKIWPVIEVYNCTEIERQALIDKIRFNGCKIMRIGKPKDFINASVFWSGSKYEPSPAYLKAKIIKINDLGEDFHVVKQISEELNKGVFVEYIGG